MKVNWLWDNSRFFGCVGHGQVVFVGTRTNSDSAQKLVVAVASNVLHKCYIQLVPMDIIMNEQGKSSKVLLVHQFLLVFIV
jgi:hypothetical protein